MASLLRPTRSLLGLCILLALSGNRVQADPIDSGERPTQWARVQETLVPVRSGTTRNAEIITTVRKNEALAVLAIKGDWVEVRLDSSRKGFVPKTSVALVDAPIKIDPRVFGGTLSVVLFICLLLLVFAAISVYLLRRRQAGAHPSHLMETRQQNKIQLLFSQEPRIHSQLMNQETDLSACLRALGYQPALEKNPDRFLAACKALRPHLVLAGADHLEAVEKSMTADAQLINTPVVYFYEEEKPKGLKARIRSCLPMHSTDRDLAREIAACLKKSPRKIQYSVNKVALSGAIRNGTLPELVHFLSTMRKTGELLLSSQNAQGKVILIKGEVIRATWDAESEKALEKILDLSTGTFEFQHRRLQAKDSLPSGHTETLLLQWAKHKDESDHRTRN